MIPRRSTRKNFGVPPPEFIQEPVEIDDDGEDGETLTSGSSSSEYSGEDESSDSTYITEESSSSSDDTSFASDSLLCSENEYDAVELDAISCDARPRESFATSDRRCGEPKLQESLEDGRNEG